MKLIPILCSLLLVCSCSTQRQIVSNDQDEEIIDLGYTRVSSKSNTTSARKFNISKQPVTYDNIFDYLRGRVSGLYIGASDGSGTMPEMYIRGINSINADTTPLILVDGAESANISYLDPYMVESVSVLKGPEAAIYGARGANGVILIRTKTGAN